MYLTRTKASKKLPIPRKGTKYVVRAASHYTNGVPVVIAVRDMLKLAKTSKEVQKMINSKLLKINGKLVKDVKESIRLFNILDAGKKYKLTLLPTGRFAFEETSDKNRIVKVVNKSILKKGGLQLNLYDGTNILTKDKINVGDSVELDFDSKIKKVISLEKGKTVFIESGRSKGLSGKIENVNKNKVIVNLGERSVDLFKSHVIVIK